MQEKQQEKSPIKQKIWLYLARNGITANEFYKTSGVTRGILQQPNGISEDNIARFLAYAPDVNTEWLLTGKGDMLKVPSTFGSPSTPKDDQHQKSGGLKIQKTKSGNSKGIPLIPLEAIAGFPVDPDESIYLENCERYVVPEFENKGANFLIRVSGDSMIPLYYSGDLLACRKITDIRFFQWGTIYVLETSQGILVKRVQESEDHEDCILCVSENSSIHKPFLLPRDDIRSLSVIVGLIRTI